MKALVFDETGRAEMRPRREVLLEYLSSLEIDSSVLRFEAFESTDALLFAHSTDLDADGHQENTLRQAAENGAAVILYSGGGVEESVSDAGRGSLYVIPWTTLKEILSRLPRSFRQWDFRRTFDSVRKRHVLHALAILSWCTMFPNEHYDVRKKQMEWKLKRDKWLTVFGEGGRDDLLIACGGSPATKLPEELSEVTKIIEWLFISPAEASATLQPRFEIAFAQIRQAFGITI